MKASKWGAYKAALLIITAASLNLIASPTAYADASSSSVPLSNHKVAGEVAALNSGQDELASSVPLEGSAPERFTADPSDLGLQIGGGSATHRNSTNAKSLYGRVTVDQYLVEAADSYSNNGNRNFRMGPRKPGMKTGAIWFEMGGSQDATGPRDTTVTADVGFMRHNPKKHRYGEILNATATSRNLIVAPLGAGPALSLADDWVLIHLTAAPANHFSYETEKSNWGGRLKLGTEAFLGENLAFTGELEAGRYARSVKHTKGSASLRFSTRRNNNGGPVFFVEPKAVYESTTQFGMDGALSNDSVLTTTVNLGIAGAAL